MDISNFLIIAIPSATTLFSCGVRLEENKTNYFIRYSYALLFCFLAVILSFLSVFADIPRVTIDSVSIAGDPLSIGGIELAISFFLIMAVLLYAFYSSVNQIEDMNNRKIVTSIIFVFGLAISIVTVFIKQIINLI